MQSFRRGRIRSAENAFHGGIPGALVYLPGMSQTLENASKSWKRRSLS